MKSRDPLDALTKLRKERVKTTAGELAARQMERERAAAELARAREEREQAEAARKRAGTSERELLEAGSLKVHDLARDAEWQRMQNAKAETLSEAERQHVEKLRTAGLAVAETRAEFVRRNADEKSLQRHRDKLARELNREKEKSEEEAGLDNHAARQGSKR